MLNFVHIGIGQCGNRFAELFGKRGRTALAVNTAMVDMSGLDEKAVPKKNRIHIAMEGAKDGAGRNPTVGRASMEENVSMVYDSIMKAVGGRAADWFVIWAGLGGGTGTGGIKPLMEKLIEEGKNVMLAVTLPRKKEGWVVRMNAMNALNEIISDLEDRKTPPVPYIVIDNEKIQGGLDSENERIVSDLVRFSNMTENVPVASAFDDTDFGRLLSYKGMTSLIRMTFSPDDLEDTEAIMRAAREAWESSLLAKVEPADATGAVLLLSAPSKMLKKKEGRENIDRGIENLESLYPSANPYSCMYVGKNGDTDSRVAVYVLLTGLPAPEDNLDEIYEDVKDKVEQDKRRRKDRKRQQKEAQAKRKMFSYDPNNIDDDDDNDDLLEF